jgi:N-succinyldiaminopimelate aminotransferase
VPGVSPKAPTAERVAHFPTTVFSEFSALALQHGAVNLGQGFPDFDGPEEIREAAIRALREGKNQYAVGAGSPNLRAAIAEHSARFYGQTVDPQTMVTVTSGGTEALFDAILGLVNPGDEVVLFEPFYDSYSANVTMVGGTCRFVRLQPPDQQHTAWWFDPEELRAACSAKTRVIMLNTPHNPTGKVFTAAELELIAELCHKHDAYVLADEVYEHLVYPPAKHLRISTLPGMFERTITVGSAGKSFSFTGWKIGWAIASPAVRLGVQQAHQFVTFASAAPLQEAVAHALRMPDAFFARLAEEYRARRDRMVNALESARLPAYSPEGTYFVMADISATGFDDDFAFCRHLTSEARVAAIPPSAFYGAEHVVHGRGFARFAFCKTDAVLGEAAKRLGAWADRRASDRGA